MLWFCPPAHVTAMSYGDKEGAPNESRAYKGEASIQHIPKIFYLEHSPGGHSSGRQQSIFLDMFLKTHFDVEMDKTVMLVIYSALSGNFKHFKPAFNSKNSLAV